MTTMPFDDSWLRRDGLLGGRFRVDSLIKDGRFTAVYRMAEEGSGQPWILRVHIDGTEPREQAEFQQTFQHMWAILSRIENPRLPSIKDAFSLEGRTYILREQVQGTSLLTHIESGKHIDESLVRDWGGQLCDLVSILQQNGVIIGLLRPNDVYVQADGTLRLADHGPMPFWPASRRPRIIKEWLGGLAPPEALRGQELRASSDVYAIGALLHYSLTRVKPKAHASPFTLLGKHRDDVSRDFNRVIMRCLSFSPDGRFDDLRALKVALLGQAGPMGSPQADIAAKMLVSPPQLLFRDVDPKLVPTQTLSIQTSGPDERVNIKGNQPWLLTQPEWIEGERADVHVSIDPRQMPVDQVVTGEIMVVGKRGHARVPVEASVQPSGLAASSALVAGILQLLAPLLVSLPTLALLQFVHMQTAQLLGGKHPVPEDVALAGYLASGFSAWLILQPLILPLVCMLVFSRVNRLQQSRLFPVYLLSLLFPLLLMGAVVSLEGAIHLPGSRLYMVAYGVAWLMGVLVFSDFAWLPRLPDAAHKPLALLTRLLFGLAIVGGLLAVFWPVPLPEPHAGPPVHSHSPHP